MDWGAFLSGLVGAGFGSTVVGVLLKTWLDHRLALERTVLTDRLQREQKVRDASIAVADILGEWVYSAYDPPMTDEKRWRLQKAYWRGILGLDRSLLAVLLPRLANDPSAVSTNEIILEARAALLGLEKPDLDAEELNNWLPRGSQLPQTNP